MCALACCAREPQVGAGYYLGGNRSAHLKEMDPRYPKLSFDPKAIKIK